MKRLTKITAVLAAAACLSACTGIPTSPLVPASAQVGLLQVSTTADVVYNATAKSYLAFASRLPPATKARAKTLLQQARPFILAADHAEALGDAATFNAQFEQATALINQVKALLPSTAH